MTKAEACLWNYVLRAGMMKGYTFRRQRPVLNFIADFMCKELMLIIEVDGIIHSDDKIAKRDEDRQMQLTAVGFTVIRFTNHQVLKEIEGTRRTIEQYVDTQETKLGTRPRQVKSKKSNQALVSPEVADSTSKGHVPYQKKAGNKIVYINSISKFVPLLEGV